MDPTSRIIFQRDDIKLSEFGAMDGEFLIPENGAVGYYNFQFESSFAKLNLEPLQVLVSDFTPSPFRVSTELNGKISVRVKTLPFRPRPNCMPEGHTGARTSGHGLCRGPGFSAREPFCA